MVIRYNTADYHNEYDIPDLFNEKYGSQLKDIIRKELGYSIDCRVHMRYINTEPDRGEVSIDLFVIRITLIPICKDISCEQYYTCTELVIKFLNLLGFNKFILRSQKVLEYSDILITDPDAVQLAKTLADGIFNR